MSGFDGEDDLLGLASTRVVVEIKASVNAAVRVFLLLCRTRGYKAERPPLELIRVVRGELLRAG